MNLRKINLFEYNYLAPETSGIYAIRNKLSNKFYVGQAKYLPTRAVYLNHEHNNILCSSYEKYGMHNFEIIILEECSIEDLDSREVYWISKCHSYVYDTPGGYNLTRGGQVIQGYCFTEEDCDKISKGLLKYYSESESFKERSLSYTGSNNPFYGKSHTQSSRDSISASLKLKYSNGYTNPMKGKTLSEHTKMLMSERASHRRFNKIYVICGREYVSGSSTGKYCPDCRGY